MDVERVEALGVAPLQPLLDEVAAAARPGRARRACSAAAQRAGPRALFGTYVSTDAKDSSRYLVHLSQSGLGPAGRVVLPRRRVRRDPHRLRRAPRPARRAGRAGRRRRGAAEQVMELETALAAASWDRVTNRDAEKTYTLMTLPALQANAPGFDWEAWLAALQAPGRARSPRSSCASPASSPRRPRCGPSARSSSGRRGWRSARASACARLPERRRRGGGLRVLRPHAVGHAGAARALEARRVAGGGRAGRGGRQALRRAALPAGGQGADGHARREPRRGVPAEHLDAGLDGPGDPGAGAGEARPSSRPKIGYPDAWKDYSALRGPAPTTCSATCCGRASGRPTTSWPRSASRSTATSG